MHCTEAGDNATSTFLLHGYVVGPLLGCCWEFLGGKSNQKMDPKDCMLSNSTCDYSNNNDVMVDDSFLKDEPNIVSGIENHNE